MAKLKYFCIKHGRKFLLASLFVVSGLLIAHFVSQYYHKKGLIDTIFGPQALIVSPKSLPPPPQEPIGGGSTQPSTRPSEKTQTPPNDDVKVEVFGLIKFEMSEANSWQTIAKTVS